MLNLEKYYHEDHWQGMLKIANKYWENTPEQLELLSIITDIEIAKVIWGRLIDNCFNWINKPLADLDYLRPIDCLNDDELKKRLKTVLIRFDQSAINEL